MEARLTLILKMQVDSPEDGCIMFHRNFATYLPTLTAVADFCVGGWTDPRVGLDTAVKKIIPVLDRKSIFR